MVKGPTNIRRGRPGQVEKYAGQVFHFQKSTGSGERGCLLKGSEPKFIVEVVPKLIIFAHSLAL